MSQFQSNDKWKLECSKLQIWIYPVVSSYNKICRQNWTLAQTDKIISRWLVLQFQHFLEKQCTAMVFKKKLILFLKLSYRVQMVLFHNVDVGTDWVNVWQEILQLSDMSLWHFRVFLFYLKVEIKFIFLSVENCNWNYLLWSWGSCNSDGRGDRLVSPGIV